MQNTIIKKIPVIPKLEKRLRVAAYARVSCGKDAMLHSLSAQVSYYNNYIQNHLSWEFVGVYSDEAKTGTKESRDGFQDLIYDCKSGLIDMIITKSISRFARNTVTLLKTIRELKLIGVDVFFEEQNIHSISMDGEMILTFLASFAQEESRSVSENQKWRIKKEFENGNIWGAKDNYGYIIKDKKFYVDPEKAPIVKRIFKMYLDGYGAQAIANALNADEIKPPHSDIWGARTILQIISNINYTGDIILQKTFRMDHISKKTVKNKGMHNQYYVEENHEAIIPMEDYLKAQELRKERAEFYNCKDVSTISHNYTGLMVCSCCGKNYKHKRSNNKEYWICSTFNSRGKLACSSKQIPLEKLDEATKEVINDVAKAQDLIEFIEVKPDNLLVYHLKNKRVVEVKWIDRSRKNSWTKEMKEAASRRTKENKTYLNLKGAKANGKGKSNTINN